MKHSTLVQARRSGGIRNHRKGNDVADGNSTDEFYAGIMRLADHYKLEGDERDNFIDQHMTKAGYKTVKSYVPGDNSGESGKPKAPAWFK
jgi:hypothetical protein